MTRNVGEKQRVLMIFDLAFPFVKGGAQRRFFEVGRFLAATGWQVDWLTFQSWDGPKTISHEGINYLGMARLPDLYGKDGKRNGYEPVLFAIEVTRCLARLRHYDVVWVGQWPLLHLIPILAFSFLARRELVVDWWEVWTLDAWTRYSRIFGTIGYFISTSILKCLGRVGVLVTDSKLEERRILAVGVKRSAIRRVPNGIPKDEIGDLNGVKDGAIDIVSLGRLKNHKRVDLLIEAMRVIKEEYGLMPRVAIIGDGPERDSLETQASGFGLTNITFYGFISDMTAVYQMVKSAKLCAITTVEGGGGNLTLLEAYGCGLPVVAFRCKEGIDPELVDDGKTGLLISPTTGGALAKGIVSLLNAEDNLAEMRRHVLERAAKHDWRQVGREYDNLFRSLPLR